ncbi:MAG: STAUR_1299 family protein [Acidobacteriota bacterium]
MIDYRAAVVSKAYRIVRGPDYNQVLYDLRERLESSQPIYEVALDDSRSWEYVRDNVYPPMARYMKRMKLDPVTGHGLVVVVFYGGLAHFVLGEDFVEVFREIEGLNETAFHFRVMRWVAG